MGAWFGRTELELDGIKELLPRYKDEKELTLFDDRVKQALRGKDLPDFKDLI